ncbi:lipopolysaccharide biosynthesis protein [Flavobacterium psychrotolerans]|uniref:Polysaccharide biosynthesis protein n=1 Tax=Flavobacterium psychrotolerans TaxID=2169410 RepID=A0A2U1JIC9_9FLAO|nr:MATE family efflux transporter [Flavobacterium psychrotolerans]PWA04892.1 polysaccharide biosynthesis protein [Flavobacterium psychrotolerans]
MKQKIQKVYSKVGIKSDRTKNITKHVLVSFVYKGGSIITSFLMVPLTINYLDTENYGIWLTLSSFIAWFSFFDIGLGNGLRNKFAEAKAKGDLTLARAYVSSAYFTIGSICLLLILVFFGFNFFIDWTRAFNTNAALQKELGLLMPIVFSFFCLQLVVKLITTIYTADQHHSMQGKINFFTSVGSLLAIWLMTRIGESSLLIYGLIFSSLPVLILLGLNFFAFSDKYKEFKPTFSLWKKEYLKDIFGLGMKFFIIQLSGIILFSTDNIIITQLYGPKQVVPFNIAFKYFSVSNMAFSMILAPYWSSITEAYINKDFAWIKKSMNNLFKISMGTVLIVLLMVVISPLVYQLWIGKTVTIPLSLTIYMAIFFALTIFYSPFTYFINGTGKVKLQMYAIVSTAIVNIPLSIFLAKNLGLGVSGVIIATILCLVPHIIICPLQYLKIINKKANGIWDK